jgi:hypothetical protein
MNNLKKFLVAIIAIMSVMCVSCKTNTSYEDCTEEVATDSIATDDYDYEPSTLECRWNLKSSKDDVFKARIYRSDKHLTIRMYFFDDEPMVGLSSADSNGNTLYVFGAGNEPEFKVHCYMKEGIIILLDNPNELNNRIYELYKQGTLLITFGKYPEEKKVTKKDAVIAIYPKS